MDPDATADRPCRPRFSFPFYELRRQDFQRAHAVQEPQDQYQGSLLSPQSVFDFSSAMQRRVVPMTPTAPAPPPQAGPVRKRLNLLPRTKPVASQQPKGEYGTHAHTHSSM